MLGGPQVDSMLPSIRINKKIKPNDCCVRKHCFNIQYNYLGPLLKIQGFLLWIA